MTRRIRLPKVQADSGARHDRGKDGGKAVPERPLDHDSDERGPVHMVRFGFRVPSIRNRISARTSLERHVRHSPEIKASRGWGWIQPSRPAIGWPSFRDLQFDCRKAGAA